MHSMENKSSPNILKQTQFVGEGIKIRPTFWLPKGFAKHPSKY